MGTCLHRQFCLWHQGAAKSWTWAGWWGMLLGNHLTCSSPSCTGDTGCGTAGPWPCPGAAAASGEMVSASTALPPPCPVLVPWQLFLGRRACSPPQAPASSPCLSLLSLLLGRAWFVYCVPLLQRGWQQPTHLSGVPGWLWGSGEVTCISAGPGCTTSCWDCGCEVGPAQRGSGSTELQRCVVGLHAMAQQSRCPQACPREPFSPAALLL